MPREPAMALLVAALGALALSSCAPSDSEPDRTEPTVPVTAAVPTPTSGGIRARVDGTGPPEATVAASDPGNLLLVGDSVLALVADDIASRVRSTVDIDAIDCRRLAEAIVGPCGGVPAGAVVDSGVDAIAGAIDDLDTDGVVPDATVLVLGNNSSLTDADLDDAMSILGDVPRVWWVNTRIDGFGRQDENNELLRSLADRNPRAGVIDWYAASEDEDFFADHVHPNVAGERALARLVVDHLRCDCVP